MPSPNPYLKRERQLRGWSQSYLAEQIGVADYYISRWEHGKVVPSPYYQQKLCEVFGKTAEELGFLQLEDPSFLTPSSLLDKKLGSERSFQITEPEQNAENEGNKHSVPSPVKSQQIRVSASSSRVRNRANKLS